MATGVACAAYVSGGRGPSGPLPVNLPRDPTDPDPPSQRICYCRDVDELTIRRAIRAGADSVERLAEATGASTGCGTCRYDLEKLLDEELPDRRTRT